MKTFFKTIVSTIIQYEAELILKKYKPKIIVVVGSVGKTSAKDAIYTALRPKFFVRKSEKSFNSEIGIPLTILGCQNAWSNPFAWIKNILLGASTILFKKSFPEWLVLEVGADRPGDIKNVASWLKTDVIVLTRLPDVPVHVEAFSSPESVVEEKLSIIASLKDGGTIVINGDDDIIRSNVEKFNDKKVVSFGVQKEKNNNLTASNYSVAYKNKKPTGIRFKMHFGESVEQVQLEGVLGRHHMYPTLAAVSVASIFDISLSASTKALMNHKTPPGRMRILEGIKGSTIIDDTYNSSPVALESALFMLKEIKTDGRKIAVLGDMLELGKYSIDAHKEIGKEVATFCDELITIGFRARAFAEGALNNGMPPLNILQYDDVVRAGKELEARIKEHDIILFKASQSIRMEKAVEEIMAYPERKSELLARQDAAWQKR